MTFLEENYLKTESTEYKHVLIRLTLYRANAKRIFSFIIWKTAEHDVFHNPIGSLLTGY